MLREKLRTATQASHERLEVSLDVMNIRNKKEYLTLLERLYGFYFSIENRISQFKAKIQANRLELEPRLKTAWLERDLKSLGYPSNQIINIPKCTHLPNLSTFAHVIGCLYVLEGSTLGGKVLERYFNQTLQITPENGCRFFFGYGPDTKRMWQTFLAFLYLQEKQNCNPEDSVCAARETFERMESWMLRRNPSVPLNLRPLD